MKSSKDLRALRDAEGVDAVHREILSMRKQLFELRLNAATSHVRDYPSRRKLLRKSVARALTILDEIQRG